jgi:transposase
MLIVETIRKVRLANHRNHKSIKEICRDFNLSRNTVRKIIRSDATEFVYERKVQPRPKLEPFKGQLAAYLKEDSAKPAKQRRTALLLFEQLQREGFGGGYDSVRRYVQKWHKSGTEREIKAFIPLSFAPGEAFQFDWSYEQIELAGVNVRVKVSQFRLSHSRMPYCVAYMRETMEMVLDAHVRAFRFFGGACRKGIYDNLKTVVAKVLMGKERVFNRRFTALASHYLFDPVACTPAAGWEKGQIENQVGFVRQRFFNQRRKFANLEELNQWLTEQCLNLAASHKHPEFVDKTVAEVFAAEQEDLVSVKMPFDGYQETPARVSVTSLVSFDRNRYSVHASAVGKTASVRAYADRIILLADGQTVGVHRREFGRDKTIFDPWHYLEVLKRKPGALRNGAPFKDWEFPLPLKQVRAAMINRPDGDKQFVGILSAVLTHGLEAVVNACAEAVTANTISQGVILNILSRAQDSPAPDDCDAPPSLPELRMPPVADCRRYDRLLSGGAHVA